MMKRLMMKRFKRLMAGAVLVTALMCGSTGLHAQDLMISVENLTNQGGLFITPVWFGFHDGSFDLYDLGSPASVGLERLAEDGDLDPLAGEFMAAAPTGDAVVVFGPEGFPGAPVLDPGETASATLTVAPANRYLSLASMVIPSNDAFIGNGNPLAYEVFDAAGQFTGPLEITILGNQVRDAGTEDNTEMDAAFINQAAPNTGMTTAGGVVSVHPGFLGSIGHPDGTSIILGGTNAAGSVIDPAAADFTAPGFALARITVTQVPEPGSLGLLAAGVLGLLRLRGLHRILPHGCVE